VSSTVIILIALAIYAAVYLLYGRKVARDIVKIDPSRKTPAHTLYDGVDYVPGRWPVVFGHHFASIAGAAPIVGPIVALAWGWVPCVLWVWFGNAFIGAIHDFMALTSSVRHDGKSIQWSAGEVMTPRVSFIFAIFVYLTMILVVAAFANVVAGLFVGNGSVASASVLFILIAVLIGYLIYWRRLSIVWVSVLGVALLAAAVFGSQSMPIALGNTTWMIVLFFYIIIAASLPVTILLQPRDYLNAYLLVFFLLLGGIAFLGINASFDWPTFTSFSAPTIGGQPSPFWPTVPLVIACGALSGFHAIVGSGTTSKMLDTEAHALRIGYGGMLSEGFLSTLVIVAMAAFGLSVAGLTPGEVGGEGWTSLGIGVFSESYAMGANKLFGMSVAFGTTFASLVVCCFALTTLDTTNRIARFAWGDIFNRAVTNEATRRSGAFRFFTGKWVAATIAAGLGIYLATSGEFFSALWAAFGGANQMLAAIALMTSCVWSTKVLRGGKWCPVTMIPAFFLWVTVIAAYIWYIVTMAGVVNPLTLVIMGIMAALSFYLLYEVIVALRKPPAEIKG
jgi:carbon starvation protein